MHECGTIFPAMTSRHGGIPLKYAANLLSAARILLILVLLLIYEHTAWFVTLYLLAGLTDILDGFVARRTHTQSELGARLDSVADLFLFAVVLMVLFRWVGDGLRLFLPWVLMVIVIRCISLIFSVVKYRKAVFLHTWANKLTGLAVFLCPILLALSHRVVLLWPVCFLALLSAAEEFLLHLTSPAPDVNRHSILWK